MQERMTSIFTFPVTRFTRTCAESLHIVCFDQLVTNLITMGLLGALRISFKEKSWQTAFPVAASRTTTRTRDACSGSTIVSDVPNGPSPVIGKWVSSGIISNCIKDSARPSGLG